MTKEIPVFKVLGMINMTLLLDVEKAIECVVFSASGQYTFNMCSYALFYTVRSIYRHDSGDDVKVKKL